MELVEERGDDKGKKVKRKPKETKEIPKNENTVNTKIPLKRTRGRPKKNQEKKTVFKTCDEKDRDEASSDGEILIGSKDFEIHTKNYDRLRRLKNIKLEKK